MIHFVVCITAHGYGHAAQLAPVVNALRARFPQLSLTLRTQLPRRFLASRFEGDFELISSEHDFGMEMASAIDVLPAASAVRYAALHADWESRIGAEACELETLRADFVLSGVGYLSLAGAARAGIPAAALSSLSWRDVFDHYCHAIPGTRAVSDQMAAAYASAPFIQVEPTLPMQWHPRRYAVGPVAHMGRACRDAVFERVGASENARVVLITLGGMEMRLPMETWPHRRGFHWIVPKSWAVHRPDVVALEELGLHFSDVLRSCDALVTKPGYGAFVEAACNGVPVLYVERKDWPEFPYLSRWLHAHGRAAAVTRPALMKGEFIEPLATLWTQPPLPLPAPSGSVQAAELIATWLAA